MGSEMCIRDSYERARSTAALVTAQLTARHREARVRATERVPAHRVCACASARVCVAWQRMFFQVSDFNQSLSNWNVSLVTNRAVRAVPHTRSSRWLSLSLLSLPLRSPHAALCAPHPRRDVRTIRRVSPKTPVARTSTTSKTTVAASSSTDAPARCFGVKDARPTSASLVSSRSHTPPLWANRSRHWRRCVCVCAWLQLLSIVSPNVEG